MNIVNIIADIEACASLKSLTRILQLTIENYGFSSFNMLSAGQPHEEKPFYIGTCDQSWVDTYIDEEFVNIDPCVSLVRRMNLPFVWRDVGIPKTKTVGRKSGATKIMEAAHDHGYTEGFVVPFHYRDRFGRFYSTSSAFYWTGKENDFHALVEKRNLELHFIMIYWAQRVIDIRAEKNGIEVRSFDIQDFHERARLTDRERDALAWAARGKTVEDTAEILSISRHTVETHLRSSIAKLNANNKTHAVVRAIYLGLVDV